MTRDTAYDRIRDELGVAQAAPPAQSLPHLRAVVDQVTELIDEALAAAVLSGDESLRSAGAAAGLTENAVGPRLARTPALAPYANAAGRVTADGVRRAMYDAERGAVPPPSDQGSSSAPMRFKARRRSST